MPGSGVFADITQAQSGILAPLYPYYSAFAAHRERQHESVLLAQTTAFLAFMISRPSKCRSPTCMVLPKPRLSTLITIFFGNVGVNGFYFEFSHFEAQLTTGFHTFGVSFEDTELPLLPVFRLLQGSPCERIFFLHRRNCMSLMTAITFFFADGQFYGENIGRPGLRTSLVVTVKSVTIWAWLLPISTTFSPSFNLLRREVEYFSAIEYGRDKTVFTQQFLYSFFTQIGSGKVPSN